MNNSLLRGSGVALVTPFTSSGDVDFDALKALIEHVIAGGINYLVALGTTGEPPTLDTKEKRIILEFILEVNNNRLPVVAGMGSNDTRSLVKELREFMPMGFTAILSASPYYNKPNQEGIYRHYQALAEVSPLPILLYNVPFRTGSNITAETTLKLAHNYKNIIGIKEASGNFTQFDQIIKGKPSDFLFISGDDAIALPIMSIGGDGLISVIANALPAEIARLIRLSLQGNFLEALQIHKNIAEIIQLIFIEGNPAGVKAMLHQLGVCQDELRLPLVKVSTGLYQKIQALQYVLQETYKI